MSKTSIIAAVLGLFIYSAATAQNSAAIMARKQVPILC